MGFDQREDPVPFQNLVQLGLLIGSETLSAFFIEQFPNTRCGHFGRLESDDFPRLRAPRQELRYFLRQGTSGGQPQTALDNLREVVPFRGQLPRQFEVARENVALQGIVVELDDKTGRAREIRRLRVGWEAND